MERREITAAVVEEAQRLLAEGMDPSTIATRLGITEYVADLLARNVSEKPDRIPPPRTARRVPNSQRAVGATAIRGVQRMLEAGLLSKGEIARAAGVSDSTVYDVAAGKRPAVNRRTMVHGKEEQVLLVPIRCRGCRALISVIPCRVCRLRLAVLIQILFARAGFFIRFPKVAFHAWQILASLTEYLNHKHKHGGRVMQELLPALSAEITAFLKAADKREHLIARAEKLFDEVIEPIDLPGPDRIVDPLLRSVIRPLVSRVYDELAKKLEVQAHAA